MGTMDTMDREQQRSFLAPRRIRAQDLACSASSYMTVFPTVMLYTAGRLGPSLGTTSFSGPYPPMLALGLPPSVTLQMGMVRFGPAPARKRDLALAALHELFFSPSCFCVFTLPYFSDVLILDPRVSSSTGIISIEMQASDDKRGVVRSCWGLTMWGVHSCLTACTVRFLIPIHSGKPDGAKLSKNEAATDSPPRPGLSGGGPKCLARGSGFYFLLFLGAPVFSMPARPTRTMFCPEGARAS
ncbi:hypothetical protein CONLIGDRAFT_335617 [Coniochaeta ligniaria NRRL 30616]|uniref:Uncharacterized protein n=1 Tax=Coniochaeta ligniaria NRRL 30616 TaxID=1408157 RepID=A0A1J7JPF3_9PEZI|nr:hypothetical protein CONLIGDRAFT_335617 [Coniochaeta ligniaria NRRL 30616]